MLPHPNLGVSIRSKKAWRQFQHVIPAIKTELRAWVISNTFMTTLKAGLLMFHGNSTGIPFSDGTNIPKGPAYFAPSDGAAMRYWGDEDWHLASYELDKDLTVVEIEDKDIIIHETFSLLKKHYQAQTKMIKRLEDIEENISADDLDGIFVHLGFDAWLSNDEGGNGEVHELMLVHPEKHVQFLGNTFHTQSEKNQQNFFTQVLFSKVTFNDTDEEASGGEQQEESEDEEVTRSQKRVKFMSDSDD